MFPFSVAQGKGTVWKSELDHGTREGPRDLRDCHGPHLSLFTYQTEERWFMGCPTLQMPDLWVFKSRTKHGTELHLSLCKTSLHYL